MTRVPPTIRIATLSILVVPHVLHWCGVGPDALPFASVLLYASVRLGWLFMLDYLIPRAGLVLAHLVGA